MQKRENESERERKRVNEREKVRNESARDSEKAGVKYQ
jgi:hypothetical protein